ncbi:unnamed protein product [Mytilus edulis]|uniref:Uncharacterized protein n=1 Tax=Mytilus edulis TaxID=6550 RepID=A0A8S3SG88_MYTED|nr:unnamed protein product [Mytilus edulis]
MEDIISTDHKEQPKRFWSYIKSRKQESTGIVTLKDKDGLLHSDTQTKASILNQQFQSVYTKEDIHNMPHIGPSPFPTMDNIRVSQAGVYKLLLRRCKDRLTMAYKIHNRLVDIDPSNYYKPGDSRTRGGHRIHQQRTLKNQNRYSFFPRSTREWNTLPCLPEKATTAATLEEFKANLAILPEALTGASHT